MFGEALTWRPHVALGIHSDNSPYAERKLSDQATDNTLEQTKNNVEFPLSPPLILMNTWISMDQLPVLPSSSPVFLPRLHVSPRVVDRGPGGGAGAAGACDAAALARWAGCLRGAGVRFDAPSLRGGSGRTDGQTPGAGLQKKGWEAH